MSSNQHIKHILRYPLLLLPQSSPASGSFPMSQLFTSGGQSIGVSASALVLPMNIQDWFPLGLTGWIFLQSKGFSRVFCSTPGLPVHHQLPALAQTHVHWVSDAIQLTQPLSSPSPAFSLSQHQGLYQWVSSSYQVAKVLEFQLQHQSFQWIFRTDFL